jgi:hypothetical protein
MMLWAFNMIASPTSFFLKKIFISFFTICFTRIVLNSLSALEVVSGSNIFVLFDVRCLPLVWCLRVG